MVETRHHLSRHILRDPMKNFYKCRKVADPADTDEREDQRRLILDLKNRAVRIGSLDRKLVLYSSLRKALLAKSNVLVVGPVIAAWDYTATEDWLKNGETMSAVHCQPLSSQLINDLDSYDFVDIVPFMKPSQPARNKLQNRPQILKPDLKKQRPKKKIRSSEKPKSRLPSPLREVKSSTQKPQSNFPTVPRSKFTFYHVRNLGPLHRQSNVIDLTLDPLEKS